MRISAIICEFNPFHNGHKYLIDSVKANSDCDAVLCIMSGPFTQRGEIAICDKFTRAKHAVLGGADCVIELPAPFAVAPAEIFAKGAVKILSSIHAVKCLAFGSESLNKESLLSYANVAIKNKTKLEKLLKDNMENGQSYLSSYQKALATICGNGAINFGSNDILALEYTKAIISSGADIHILPIRRIGGNFNDDKLIEGFSSATAIRANLGDVDLKNNLPEFSYDDLPKDFHIKEIYENYARFALVNNDKAEIKKVYGCSEGLENKLKNSCLNSYNEIISDATSKRYTSSRIRRILCANLLKLYRSDCESFLKNDLYIKPLAINKSVAKNILAELAKSNFPTVILQRQLNKLAPVARKCFDVSSYCDEVYSFITDAPLCNFTIIKI